MRCLSVQCHKNLIGFHVLIILPVVRTIASDKLTKHIEDLLIRPNAPSLSYQNSVPKGFYSYLQYNEDIMYRRFQNKVPTQVVDPNKWEVKKRSRLDLVAAKPACPYSTEWKLIYQARDINDTEVTVYQPEDVTSGGFQWFYTATCDTAQINRENPHCPNCCRGIDHNRYTSNCIPKKSYVMAFIKRNGRTQYEWDWIQIKTGCSCAVSDRYR